MSAGFWSRLFARGAGRVPPGLREAPVETQVRAELIPIVAAVSGAISACVALGLVAAGRIAVGAGAAAYAVVIAVGPVAWMRASQRVSGPAYAIAAGWYVFTLVATLLRGGAGSPALMGFASVPLVAGVLGGRRHALLWLAAAVAAVLVFGILHAAGVQLPDTVSAERRWLVGTLGAVVFLVAVAVVVASAEHVRHRLLAEVDRAHAERVQALEQRGEAERRLSDVERARVDQMASVGQLAAGVAHEINNPLAYVVANLDYLAGVVRDVPDAAFGEEAAEVRSALADARVGAGKVQQIVKDLRTFARAGDEESLTAVDLVAAAESMVRMAGAQIHDRARLVTDYAAAPAVLANHVRLGQVLLNLIVNAVQALPPDRVDDNVIALRVGTDDRGRGFVEVEDNGCGIPADILPRVTEPFFTTKPVGEGTGLGLAVCQNVADRLGGELTIASEVGVGTRVRLALRAAGADAPREQPARSRPPARRRGSPGLGAVLIVDDDPLVRRALERLLAGSDVSFAAGGREALAALAERWFDAVLCDLMMPGVSGMDVYEQVRRRNPRQAERFVFVTGGAFTPRAMQFADEVPNPVLHKPLDPEAVVAVLRDPVGKARSA